MARSVQIPEVLKALTPELIPIAVKALNALIAGHGPKSILNQAERDLLTAAAKKALDEALG